jgi:hypothetical protein
LLGLLHECTYTFGCIILVAAVIFFLRKWAFLVSDVEGELNRILFMEIFAVAVLELF